MWDNEMKMNFAAISSGRYLKYANAIVLIQLFPAGGINVSLFIRHGS